MALGVVGASMFIGDSMITPRDFGVVRGRGSQARHGPALEHYVVPLTVFILVVLFAVQRGGTAARGPPPSGRSWWSGSP